jgi:hypothetical protein
MKLPALALAALLALSASAFAQGVDSTLQTPAIYPGIDGGSQFVRLEPTQIFWDDYGATLDTTNRWTTPTTGGGGNATAATNSGGSSVLGSGTTASGWSILQSQTTFAGRNPGYITFQEQNNIEFPVITGAYRFWGFATIPGSPTVAAPLTDAVGFAVHSNGHLFAETWAAGSLALAIDLSIPATGYQLCQCIGQPPDSGVHKYQINFRGDNILWWVDGRLVYRTLSGAPGPVVNTLPVAHLAVAGLSNISASATITLNGTTIGDSSRNAVQISDGTFPWRKVVVDANGSLQTTKPFTQITGNAAGSTAAVVGTLAAATGKLTYICGFNVSAIGGTASVCPVTVAGTTGSSQVYQCAANTAAGAVIVPTNVFTPCIPSSAVNTAITITTTADATATAVDVNSWGYQQ